MADVTNLVARIEERRRRLDQIDQALDEMRKLLQGREAIAKEAKGAGRGNSATACRAGKKA